MTNHCRRFLLVLLLCWLALPALAEQPPPGATLGTPHVTAQLRIERQPIAPGTAVELALDFQIIPGWHTYWRNPGDSGEPPHVRWTLPEGVTIGPLGWPIPERIPIGPLANYGYSGRVVHPLTLRLPETWPPGQPLTLVADADWLVCDEHCVPESGRFVLEVPTAIDPGPEDAEAAEALRLARARLPAPTPVSAQAVLGDHAWRLHVPLATARSAVPELDGWLAASAADPDALVIEWFAGDWGMIEHAAPQDWRHLARHDALVGELLPGVAASSAKPDGLLVLRRGEQALAFEVEVTNSAADPVDAAVASPVADRPLGLPLALLFALLGGLLLNLMPCVFPVLTIKALGLARQQDAPLAQRLAHGLFYTAGVLAFFALIGVVLLALRAGGAALGWGFQLQSPTFVALMTYLFLLLGLALAGALNLGTGIMSLGGALAGGAPRPGANDAGHWSAFATGALAALIAAPCTAPFMGAALGYALTLPGWAALAILLTLGLGMALPFALLALLPGWAQRLPKPGVWMERLKQLLAFPLLATAAWLLWVLTLQRGATGLAAILAGMLALTFGLWLLEVVRDARPLPRRLGATLAWLAILAALLLGWRVEGMAPVGASGDAASPSATPDAAGPSAQPYLAERLAEARAAERPTFVNITAAWCITCLVNERVALNSPQLARRFAETGMLYLKGDWTDRDPLVTAYLEHHGRASVPLYVYYPPGGEPEILPQILTEALVLERFAALPPVSP